MCTICTVFIMSQKLPFVIKLVFFSNGTVNCVLTGLLFDNLANYNELKIQLFLGCFVIVDVVVVIIVVVVLTCVAVHIGFRGVERERH